MTLKLCLQETQWMSAFVYLYKVKTQSLE